MSFSLKKLVYSSFLWALVFCNGEVLAKMPIETFKAHSYVIDNRHHLLIPKSVSFVEILSHELKAKTSYNLYVAVLDSIPSDIVLDSKMPQTSKQKRLAYKNMLIENLPKPYTLILFMKEDEKIDIISSSPRTYLDEDKVFFEYMIPLLPKQKDEALTNERISAIVLNGYATAADMIAHHFGVALENNMPLDESGGREFVRFSMYAMLLVLFGLIGFIYLTRKR